MAALIVGCIGIVVAGLVLTIVTAVLASLSGSRAREAGRSMDDGYLGLLLAAVDGVSWIVAHLLFQLPFLIG